MHLGFIYNLFESKNIKKLWVAMKLSNIINDDSSEVTIGGIDPLSIRNETDITWEECFH